MRDFPPRIRVAPAPLRAQAGIVRATVSPLHGAQKPVGLGQDLFHLFRPQLMARFAPGQSGVDDVK